MNPRVTHVIVPAGGEALTEELRRHGKDPIGGEGALAEPKGDVSPQKVGFERDSGTGTETGGGGGGGDRGGIDSRGKTPRDRRYGSCDRRGDERRRRPAPSVGSPGCRDGRLGDATLARKDGGDGGDAFGGGDPRTPSARVKEERARELAERKAAEKRRREEDEAGIERRPGEGTRDDPRRDGPSGARNGAASVSRATSGRQSRGGAWRAKRAPTLAGTELARAGSDPPSGGPSHAALGASPAAFGLPRVALRLCGVRHHGQRLRVLGARRTDVHVPDFVGSRSGSSRAGSHVCKHLMRVYMRVLGVSRDDPALCQVALLQSELAAMLSRPSAAQRATLAAASAREAYLCAAGLPRGSEEDAPAPVRRRPTRRIPRVPDGKIANDADDVPIAEEDDEEPKCPVCFEDVEDAADRAAGSLDPSSVWWCRGGCGGNVHARCMRMWIQKSGSSTCPLCRAPWISQEPGAAADAFANDGGVLPAAVPPPRHLPGARSRAPGGRRTSIFARIRREPRRVATSGSTTFSPAAPSSGGRGRRSGGGRRARGRVRRRGRRNVSVESDLKMKR